MTTSEKYNYWLQNENTDEKIRIELKDMKQAEIDDAFYKNIEFGTAGMRGLLGAGSNRINIHTIRKANAGFAEYISRRGAHAKKRGVAIGYDNRHMSYELAEDSAKMLASFGIKTYIFEELRPTPELSFAVRCLDCFGGIMITASHNPKEYNGYKLYDETGCQLIPKLADEVISLVNGIEDPLQLKPEANIENGNLIEYIGESIDEKYYAEVLNIRLNPEVNKDIKIVFSPEHGASNIAVQTTLRRAGYSCIVVEEQATPDPDFSNTKTPNPEDDRAYELAIEYAHRNVAELVLVCDPDGDRMGVAVRKNDTYEILSGNQTGAILIEYIFSQLKEHNKMPANAVMFNTVVTSDLGEKIADHYGVMTEKTLTGFKFIGEKIEEYDKTKEKSYVFGYEESYGSLIKPFVRDKDATQACLMLAEAAAHYNNEGKTLVDVLNELYQKHGFYYETQTSITLEGQEGAKKLKAIIENFRMTPITSVAGINVVGSEDYGLLKKTYKKEVSRIEGFTEAEVLKYYLEDGSWLAVRPSGTEPKCKVYYCIKGNTMHDAKEKAEKIIIEMDNMMK